VAAFYCQHDALHTPSHAAAFWPLALDSGFYDSINANTGMAINVNARLVRSVGYKKIHTVPLS